MDYLYPSLEEKFQNEGVCPICMQGMEFTPKFSCVNNHVLCHRCKPYYFSCPKCHAPIDVEIPPSEMNPYNPPPPVHLMPHPMPQAYAPYPTQIHMPMPMPSAPMATDFHDHERQSWSPDTPTEDQELIPCSYTRFGCWVKFPEHLRDIHESRCRFQNFGTDQSTDYHSDDENLVDCTYKSAGCNLQIPERKRMTHEEDCPYKGRFEAFEKMNSSMASVSIEGESWDGGEFHDPEEIVECRFKEYGCMVRMPFRRKRLHEEKCNFHESGDEESEPETYEDPEQQVDCKWAEYGCRVRPKLCRKETHEEKCNYKLDECAFKDYGCSATFHSSKRFAHERSCQYAS